MNRTPREGVRSEEHTSELQSRLHLVCRLLLEKKKHLNLFLLFLCTFINYFFMIISGMHLIVSMIRRAPNQTRLTQAHTLVYCLYVLLENVYYAYYQR